MSQKYIALDCEMGGIGEDKSLLTAYYGILDSDFNLLDELDLRLIPDDGIYHIDPKGLAICKINLVELYAVAIPYKEGGTKLYNFLQRNWNSGDDKFIPVGHKVAGDILQTERLISSGSWDRFCSYRALDTCAITQFLRLTGYLKGAEPTASVDSLAKYFGVTQVVPGQLHEARYDALTTAEILKKLRDLVVV
jgi:hypothetical protein